MHHQRKPLSDTKKSCIASSKKTPIRYKKKSRHQLETNLFIVLRTKKLLINKIKNLNKKSLVFQSLEKTKKLLINKIKNLNKKSLVFQSLEKTPLS
ncbi:hypothetical protein DW078_23560 [Bacteroides fragilis]|nr:hypothetical protein DW078_23560 [Bacteroides fragilis]